VEVCTPRGSVQLPARIGQGPPGTVFVPFHYGGDGAANELTITAWDPVSKQPMFKVCGCRVQRIGPGNGRSPAPEVAASAPAAAGR